MGCCSNARFLYFRCLSQLVSPNNFPHCIDKHPAETVEKLRFPTICIALIYSVFALMQYISAAFFIHFSHRLNPKDSI